MRSQAWTADARTGAGREMSREGRVFGAEGKDFRFRHRLPETQQDRRLPEKQARSHLEVGVAALGVM